MISYKSVAKFNLSQIYLSKPKFLPPMCTSQLVSFSPSLPNSSILQVYLPESSSSASLISKLCSPSGAVLMRNLGSLFLISLPSLYHLTRASGLSVLHLSFTFRFFFPAFFFSSFFSKPNSGSAAVTGLFYVSF